jgi:hypothetical protein
VLSASTDLEVMRRRRGDISDGRLEHPTFVAYVANVGVEPQEKVIGLSRGDGRLQRRILELLEQSPESKKNREDLDEVLVEEGYDPSNILRAIKGLARKHRVGFTDRAHKSDSLVSLPRKVRRITDEELFELLAKSGGGR